MHLFDLFLCVFKMSSQIACLRGGIFALVAFIWLVSTMCFQMSVQNACIRGYEVALDASFVPLFPAVGVFKCVLKQPAREDV